MSDEIKLLLTRNVKFDRGSVELVAYADGSTIFWAFDDDDTVMIILESDELDELRDALEEINEAHIQRSREEYVQELEEVKAEFEKRSLEIQAKIASL